MFIDNEIGGKNADGFPNIQGNDFLKELMYLSDTENKPKIEVWINSPGGIVTEGQSIHASILASIATVDTVCYGIAASIAGVVFQAGRKRKMFDFAHLMYHPAYSTNGVVDKGLEALNNSICTMIASRTGKTEDEIWAIMNRGRADDKGTWISAEEALANGFCDEIIYSDSKNKNAIEGDSTTSIWKSANKIYNRVTEKEIIKPKKMKQVLNKLGLIEDANEASALAAIDALNKKAESMEDAYNKKCAEMDKLNKELMDMKNAMEEEKKAKAKLDAEEAENKAKVDKETKAKLADTEIKNAVDAGKFKNDPEIITKWKNAFEKNFDSTKEIIEALPATKVSPKFVNDADVDIKDSEAEASARKAGLKPGTSAWYNSIKSYEIVNKK
jgi:ATP-dependent protease ClpP protease subunit